MPETIPTPFPTYSMKPRKSPKPTVRHAPRFLPYDENRKLVYRGQYDSSRPKNTNPVTGEDLKSRRCLDPGQLDS